METGKAISDDPSGICRCRAVFPEIRSFRAESTLIAPVKCRTLSPVTLTAGHLTHPVSAHPCLLGPEIVKKARGALPQETFAVNIEATSAPDLSAAFLGKQHLYTVGKAIVRAAALGPACAARATLVARPLTPFGGVRTCAAPSAGLSSFTLSRHACFLPGAVVQLLFQSPHLQAQGELHPFAKSSFISHLLPPSILASSASYPWCCVIADTASFGNEV